jgi:hypothetical protein
VIDYSVGELIAILAGTRPCGGSGEDIAKNQYSVGREEVGMTPEMLKLQCTGQGYDGKYHHCSVPQHFYAKLLTHRSQDWTLPGWDDAHQIELTLNDELGLEFNGWYKDLAEKCSRITCKIKFGKNYEKARVIAESPGRPRQPVALLRDTIRQR